MQNNLSTLIDQTGSQSATFFNVVEMKFIVQFHAGVHKCIHYINVFTPSSLHVGEFCPTVQWCINR